MLTFRGNTSWLALFGAGFFWAWLDCLVALPTLYEPFGSTGLVDNAYLLTYTVSIVPIVAALLFPVKVDRSTSNPNVGIVIGAFGTLGCAGVALGGFLSSLPLIVAGVSVSGMTLGALLVLWGRVCVSQGSTHTIVHITGAYAVSLFVDLIVIYLQAIPAVIFLSLCPLISGALFWILVKYTKDGKELELGSASTYYELGADVAPDKTVHFDAQLVSIIFAFYCVLGIANYVNNPSSMGATGSLLYGLAWEISGFVMFLGCIFLGWRAKKLSLFGISMLVLATIMVFMPLPERMVHSGSGSFMAAGCTAFDVLCWSLASLAHYFTRRPYLSTVGIVVLCQQLGTLVGYSAGYVFPESANYQLAFMVAATIMCVGLVLGIVYTLRSNKKLLSALFSDAAVDDLPEEVSTPTLPSGATLSYSHPALSVTKPRKPQTVADCDGMTSGPLDSDLLISLLDSERPEQAPAKQEARPNAGKDDRERPPSSERASSSERDERLSNERLERIADQHGLTRREREVFAHLAKGRSAPYIAELYQVSENTVRSHIKHIYTKIDVHSRQELLSFVRDAD